MDPCQILWQPPFAFSQTYNSLTTPWKVCLVASTVIVVAQYPQTMHFAGPTDKTCTRHAKTWNLFSIYATGLLSVLGSKVVLRRKMTPHELRNRLPLSRHCQNSTSSKRGWARISVLTWELKYCTHITNTSTTSVLQIRHCAAKYWWCSCVWMLWMTPFATGRQQIDRTACLLRCVHALRDEPSYRLASTCPHLNLSYSTVLPWVCAEFLALVPHWLLDSQVWQVSNVTNYGKVIPLRGRKVRDKEM